MHPYLIAPPRLHPNGPQPRSVADRFWRKVQRTDSCWLWTGCRDHHGYGQMTVGSMADGSRRHEKAHRVSFILHRGDIPDGLEVCHNCPGGDVPACVNPDHLFLDDHLGNMRDAWKKGQMWHGQHPKTPRLTAAQVSEIRRRYQSGGVLQRQLAQEFGIGSGYISRIVRRIIWRHDGD